MSAVDLKMSKQNKNTICVKTILLCYIPTENKIYSVCHQIMLKLRNTIIKYSIIFHYQCFVLCCGIKGHSYLWLFLLYINIKIGKNSC